MGPGFHHGAETRTSKGTGRDLEATGREGGGTLPLAGGCEVFGGHVLVLPSLRDAELLPSSSYLSYKDVSCHAEGLSGRSTHGDLQQPGDLQGSRQGSASGQIQDISQRLCPSWPDPAWLWA